MAIRMSSTQAESPTTTSSNIKTESSSRILSTIVEVDLVIRHVHGKSILAISNTTVAPLYLAKVVDALTRDNPRVKVQIVILSDGEQHKNMASAFDSEKFILCYKHCLLAFDYMGETLMKVFNKAIELRLDRLTTLVTSGSGVIGDIGCFPLWSKFHANSIYFYGVDSFVRGNTGINHPLGKNLIGVYYHPRALLGSGFTLSSFHPCVLLCFSSPLIQAFPIGFQRILAAGDKDSIRFNF
ncbi:hypothetical protein Cgig2_006487 [Carnegiea gigantea]|uniref:3-dehydroquinate synthase N-terminal domain-containing protein n=1 Tax=Carnegiea gigantea TaxID=171969 RepID=A0A9Q1KBH8_9CARY|nr:hypothetical protein Cgig2_006487 [Carnegiea gigantea]